MEGSIFAVAWYRSEPTGQGIGCRGLLMARANQYDQRRCSIRTVPDSEGAERNVDRICIDRDIGRAEDIDNPSTVRYCTYINCTVRRTGLGRGARGGIARMKGFGPDLLARPEGGVGNDGRRGRSAQARSSRCPFFLCPH
jgi:hypothetical protein